VSHSGSGLAPSDLIEKADRSIAAAGEARCLFEQAEGDGYAGSRVEVEGMSLANFGSCSYLGLEQRPELKAGAIEAINRYGTQFSYSRAYLSSPLYAELETLLGRITGGHVVVTPTTSLGHIAAMPALIRSGDAVLIDRSTHASAHTATALLGAIPVLPVPHNDMVVLEREIERLSRVHERVWYLLDGVYSMFGDVAPFDAVNALLARYPKLHVYVDDAHATSWTGKNGRGLALENLKERRRIVVAMSLNKAFSAGGGCVVVFDPEDVGRIRRTGPMVFAGPVQPPMVGAAVASARLHLEPSFEKLQSELRRRIHLATALAREHRLPLVCDDATPIFFIVCGSPEATFSVARALRTRGIYVNISVFPAVPYRQAGIRFTLSLHNSDADIHHLMESLAAELNRERPGLLVSKAVANDVNAVALDAE
jgi:7-keto-8-aminopelargonate synthetase-like enzyme